MRSQAPWYIQMWVWGENNEKVENWGMLFGS